jgi:Fe-S-cluster-containing dehydrogenase component
VTKKVYLIPNRCLGCEECIEACAKEHEWAARNYVEWIDMVYPVQMHCSHCVDAPCARVCPVDAIKTTEEDAIVIDEAVCIGCANCALVCPFGIPRFSGSTKKVVKCDLCIDRLREGKEPACVENCPVHALVFVDIEEYETQKRERAARRILEAGTYLREILMPQEG